MAAVVVGEGVVLVAGVVVLVCNGGYEEGLAVIKFSFEFGKSKNKMLSKSCVDIIH